LHIERPCCNSLKILGFIKRITTEFKLASPLKALNCSIVRPILEYGSIIWDPYTAKNAIMLERVHNKFFKVMYIIMIEFPPHNYLPVLDNLKLESLANEGM